MGETVIWGFVLLYVIFLCVILPIIISHIKKSEKKSNALAANQEKIREENKRREREAKKQNDIRDRKEQQKKEAVTAPPASGHIHNIVCPFCYDEFSPREVRFRFDINGIPTYLSADPNSEETKNFCKENGNLYARIVESNGLPVMFTLCRQDNTVVMESPIRVCRNDKCNEPISPKAGTYSADNGLFVIGLKSSGKTVYITSAINRLNDIIPRYFGCNFMGYNKNVADRYMTQYYNAMYIKNELPAATMLGSQLTYEVVNPVLRRTVGITFSDIAGEIADNPGEVFLGESKKIMSHSNYFLLTIDLKEMSRNQESRAKTANVINDVLSLATVDANKKGRKYLAVVITKSDDLVGFDNDKKGAEVFRRDMSFSSPIYNDVKYNVDFFNNERNTINNSIKYYMKENYPELVVAAETAFEPENINYFAVSALGQTPVNGKLQSNLTPIRVEEPVLWLLSKSGVLQQ